MMAGSMGGNFETGRTLDFDKADNDKMSSLYLTILERVGLQREKFGNSSQALTGIRFLPKAFFLLTVDEPHPRAEVCRPVWE